MIRRVYGLALSLVPVASACLLSGWIIRNPAPPAPATVGAPAVPEEAKHLGHVRHPPLGGQNAEATSSRDGKHIVFTSTRNGDLDIYTMNADGSSVKQLTNELGYDGGPFWSYDGQKIVYRAEHPKTPEEIADYQGLLSKGLIRPGNLEIW